MSQHEYRFTFADSYPVELGLKDIEQFKAYVRQKALEHGVQNPGEVLIQMSLTHLAYDVTVRDGS
jgi:hypothetical protein